MFYLIEREYVGPNDKTSDGSIIGETWHVMQICYTPGRTNQSDEELTTGWLGTTNDWSAYARGAFDTIEDARRTVHEAGFTVEQTVGDDEFDDDVDVAEQWITEAASRPQVDAANWLIRGLGEDGTRERYAITAATTDDQLEAAACRANDEAAEDDGVEMHGTLGFFEELRDTVGE